MSLTCPSCGTPVMDAAGIGPFCPNTKCWRIDDLRPDSKPQSRQERVDAARAVRTEQTEFERDAKRYRYAKANLRIGINHHDPMGDCHCDFEDQDDAAIDSGIAKLAKETD